MSNEVTVSHTLSVQKYDSAGTKLLVNWTRNAAFRADMAGSAGPYLGVANVGLTHTDVDLGPAGGGGGVLWVWNQNATYKVQLGLYEPFTNLFDPIMEILPGECWPFRVSVDIGREEIAGTGTSGSLGNRTRIGLKAQKDMPTTQTAAVELAYFPK